MRVNDSVDSCVIASTSDAPGVAELGGASGPGTPLPVQSSRSVARRLVTRLAGLWPCQLSRSTTGSPNIANGSTPSSPLAVPHTTTHAAVSTAGFDAMSGAPENEAADEKRSGCRAA